VRKRRGNVNPRARRPNLFSHRRSLLSRSPDSASCLGADQDELDPHGKSSGKESCIVSCQKPTSYTRNHWRSPPARSLANASSRFFNQWNFSVHSWLPSSIHRIARPLTPNALVFLTPRMAERRIVNFLDPVARANERDDAESDKSPGPELCCARNAGFGIERHPVVVSRAILTEGLFRLFQRLRRVEI
jgi:hypothetical protein